MWIIFGIIAIISTFTNLYLYGKGKKYELAMALGLSFIALTLLAQYRMVSVWVKEEDIGALLDVVPTMEVALWILTIIAILLNIAPTVLKGKREVTK